MSNHVRINIMGRDYNITTESTEESIRAIESELNEQIQEIRSQKPMMSSMDAVVLIALNLMSQRQAKDQEIDKLKEMLANVDITAPVDGTIRKIDNEGQTNVYITIQQSGAFRIKGTLNEMSMNGGLMVGSRVKV